MAFSRRRFLKYSAASGLVVAGFPAIIRSARAADTVKVAAMHDRTGSHGIYGKEMDDAAKFVAEEINAAGGVMGKQIELTAFDTGSNMQNYAQYAQRVATQDKVSVVFGGISSASRETVRPIFDRYKMLYFYSTFYEGGVCDKTVFVNAETPAQMIGPALEYSTKKYGQICSKWLNGFAKEKGYEVVAAEFFPLDVADFSSTVTKIQQAKPDMVVSGLVGAAHIGFYRQWPAAGMLGKIPLHSTVFGPWEKSFLKPEEIEGLVTSFHYFQTVDTPANKAFLDKWHAKFGADYAEIGTLAVCTYNSFYLWKAAVEKAGSFEREKVIEALESPVSFDGPGGKVTVQPTTHHSFMAINITEVTGGQFKIVQKVENVEPSDTSAVCDLIKNPNQATQYIPEG
jgi:branched-chain amino acid transport system substrate-binding protein